MDPKSGLCIGCARTLDEIARWAEMSDAERERVIAQLPHRSSGTQPELRPAAKRR
jgi:hypothetical protein